MTDPEKSLDRARDTWQKHGRSEKWIQQRMMGQETRNKLAALENQRHMIAASRLKYYYYL